MDTLYKFQTVVQTLQISGCHFGIKPPGWEYPQHYHYLFEILCCIGGKVELNIRGDKIDLLEGDWILIKSGVKHRMANTSPSHFIFFNVHFDLDDRETRKRLGETPYKKIPSAITRTSKLPFYAGELEKLLQGGLLHGTVKKNDNEQLITLSYEKNLSLQAFTLLTIEEILTLLEENKQNMPDSVECASIILTSIAHAIEDRLAGSIFKEVSIDTIAKELYLSRSQCSKSFSKVFGISPRQYISRLKLNHAKHLLLTTSFTVGKIAEMLGFQSVNHFSRQFRRWTGMSPNQYRPKQTVNDTGSPLS